MPQHNFTLMRAWSKAYEIAFEGFLIARGYYILPSYDYSGIKDDKAPRLHGRNRHLVIPDLLAWHSEKGGAWFEIKVKTHADFNRKRQHVVTGFALRHYRDYLAVKALTKLPVYVVFIHQQEQIVITDEIEALPHSHTWPGSQMDRGGTIFFKFNELKRVTPLDGLNAFLPVKEAV